MLEREQIDQIGVTFKFWIADWFAQMNNKMGGDIKKIQKVGLYMVEVWKAVGMDLSKVEFIWSSERLIAERTSIGRWCWTSRGRIRWGGLFGARRSWDGQRATI